MNIYILIDIYIGKTKSTLLKEYIFYEKLNKYVHSLILVDNHVFLLIIELSLIVENVDTIQISSEVQH
jgi:hypothetical protein